MAVWSWAEKESEAMSKPAMIDDQLVMSVTALGWARLLCICP